jgi:hypothetical protein
VSTEKRRQDIGRRLDALGPDYRLPENKQVRAEELLCRQANLTPAERHELDVLLKEADATMLRRAKALDQL